MINIYTVMLFVIGIIMGSFYNVVGLRLPKKESIVKPRSHCSSCNHELSFFELIPIVSYLFLKGKCRECGKKISIIYPLFELLTGILFVLSYIIFGFSMEMILSIIFLSILIIVIISDIKYMIIPDEVLLVGALLIIITKFFMLPISEVFNSILNGVGAFFIMWAIKITGDSLFRKESMGGGDIKLMFLLGLILGFQLSIISIFLASILALPVSLLLFLIKKTNIVPFGPFLSLAGALLFLLKFDMSMIVEFFLELI